MNREYPSELAATTLPIWRVSSLLWHAALLSLAVALPSLAHAAGLPVRVLLPMHWPAILAGLVYGWRGGLVVGSLSPIAAFLISGMPYPPMILPMTVELAAYGGIAGLCREIFRLNGFLAVLASLIIGRLLFIAVVLMAGSVSQPLTAYLQAALVPGLIAAAGQIALLPVIARWWVKNSRTA